MLAEQRSQRHMLRFAGCALISMVFTGCATSPEANDPSEGGFWRAVQGVSGGQYEERLRTREERITSEQQRSQALSRRYEEVLAEQTEVERQSQEIRGRIEYVERQIRDLERSLRSTSSENQELARQIEEAKERVRLFKDGAMDNLMTYDDLEIALAELRQIEALAQDLTAHL